MGIFPTHSCFINQPPADLELAVTPASTTALSLSYGPGLYASYFEERHGAAGSGIWTSPTTIDTATNQITGLSAGTAYDVQVRGVNGAGIGNWSPTATATTYTTPGTISDLVVTTVDSSSISLAYTPSTNATSHEYQLKVTGGSYGSATLLTSSTLTGLSSSTDYTVHIRGVNTAATGAYSNEDNAVTDASSSVGNITDAAASNVSASQLSVTFTGASGASAHQVRFAPMIPQKTSGSPTYLSTGLWSAPATITSGSSFTVPVSGHKYDVQVRGTASGGSVLGAWSNTTQASTTAAGSNVTGATNSTLPGDTYITSMLASLNGSTNTQWAFSGSPQVISYSFPQAGSNYGSPYDSGVNENTTGFAAFNETQANAVRRILFMYQMFVNITFEEITESDSTHAILRYAYSSLPATAWAYYPRTLSGGSRGGDAWFGTSHGWYNSPQDGNYAFLTMIHETGHTLGLKHPHEAFGAPFPTMPTDKDALEYEVMSYRSYTNGSTTSGYSNEGWGYPQTPMMYDIQALQYLYGERTNMVDGDTTYTFNASTGQMAINGEAWAAPGGNRIFRTIWDSAGSDTIDLTTGGYANGDATISTTAGSFSTTKAVQKASLGGGHTAQGNIYNPLDTSSAIENSVLP